MNIFKRAELDRAKIAVGTKPMLLGCSSHPEAGNTVIYEDGCIRLLCHTCGFETMKIKVATE